MTNDLDCERLFSDPKRLLLDMAQEQSLAELLQMIVDRISNSPRVALVRIWLAQSTTDCTGCPMIDECRDRSHCLHLVASAGRSALIPSAEWTRLDGAFRRVPFGVRKVGRIAATGEPIEAPDLTDPLPDWLARPDWVRAEGIRGFAGQPLVHRGEVLGVLALFARGAIGADCMGWLRMVADHAAVAIATARAFAEVEALRKKA
jgi:GAF domain-containing protein